MKKILITLLLFFNLSVGLQEGNIQFGSGTEVQAQSTRNYGRVDCYDFSSSNFWGWFNDAVGAVGNAVSSVGEAIGNVAQSIGNFFDNLFSGGGSEGEGPGEEEGESDYGFDQDTNTFEVWYGDMPDGGDPNSNVWNDPYFDTDQWGQDEWWVIENIGPYIETYYNAPPDNGNTYETWAEDLTDKLETPPTSNLTKSTLPCYNSFLLPFKKIIHFTEAQLGLISSFHFDGNNLEYFIDKYGNKFINAQTPVVQNNIVVSTNTTYQFVCIDKIKADIAQLNQSYGTTITQKQDINGNTRDIIIRAPVNNFNYCIKIESSQIEDCGVGKMVEARTVTGVAYCKTLKAEDCARGMGRKRDEFLPYGGLNLDHHTNMPDAIREFLKKALGNIAGPCTISFINTKLNDLHASAAYVNAGSEALKEDMEYLTVGYYYIMGALYCATNEEAARNALPAKQFALGALHELVSTIDVVALTEGLVMIAKGLGNMVDQNVQVLKTVLDQVVNDVITTGTVDYEKIFKKIMEAATSQLNGAYEKIKQIIDHLRKIYFTECDQYQFGDGTIGDICSYRNGEMTVMAVPIVLSVGEWAVVKATALAGKYMARTGKAVKLLDEAIGAGATITDDAGKIIIHETVGEATEEATTIVTKEADDIHFKRDNNEFEPNPTPPPPPAVQPPVINGRRPVNYEFANKIYHTTSGYDVPFNQWGFPNFEQWSERTVQITGMTGTNGIDFAKANKAAFGVEDANYHLTVNNGQYADYVWHHHEDTKSMMLVPKNLNNPAAGGVPHTGGASIAKYNNSLPSGATPLSFPSPPLK